MVRQAAPRGLGKHCHCCRQKRPTSQLIPCGASQGEGGAKHGPWCHRCILTKLHKSVTYIEEAAVAAKKGTWKCPRCDDVCPCNKCDQRRSKDSKHRKPRPQSSSQERDLESVNADAERTCSHPELTNEDDEQAAGSCQRNYVCEESDSFSSPGHSPAQTPTPRLGVGYMEYKFQDTEYEKHCLQDEDDLQQREAYSEDSGHVERDPVKPVQTQVLKGQDLDSGPSQHRRTTSTEADEVDGGEEHSARTVEAPKIIAMAKRRSFLQAAENDTANLFEPRKSLGRLLLQKIINAVVEEEDVDIEGIPQQSDSKLCRSNSVPRKVKSMTQNWVNKEDEPPLQRGISEPSATAKFQVSPPPPRKGDRDCTGQLISGPQTPSALDTVKGVLESPGRSGTPFSGSRFPLRRRLMRKGVPCRGSAGIDMKAAENSSGTSAEGTTKNKDEAHRLPIKVEEPAYPCSPDVSFESLERARLQDEEEGVVNSSVTMDRREVTNHNTCHGPLDSVHLVEPLGSPSFSPGRITSEIDSQLHVSLQQHPDEKFDIGDMSKDHPPLKRPRSRRAAHPTSFKSIRVFKPAFSDDISYEAPSPGHSMESSGSEGCSRPSPVPTRLQGLLLKEGPGSSPRGLKEVWTPPVSPYGLIQEKLYDDPWKLLVACMLLNKTSGQQMYRVIWDLFNFIPTPESALEARTEDIGSMIHSLGLYNKRAAMIQRFSREFLYSDWVEVSELHGIGKYAADAHAIFCEGRWREVEPEDHMLRKYWEWLHDTDGQGQGFLRV